MRVVIVQYDYEITAVYTIRRFLKKVNKEYGSEHFTFSKINEAIDWYSERMGAGIDIMEVKTSCDDDY